MEVSLLALNEKAVIEQASIMIGWRESERYRLDRLHAYLRGTQIFSWLPTAPALEVRRLANLARVNLLGLVVDSVAQSMYVDGYRAPKQGEDAPAWDLWQRNRMDARQIGVHRAGLTYGTAYATVLPGDPVAIIRGVSPRNMTCVYAESDDWPTLALEKRRSATGDDSTLYRLFDEENLYWVSANSSGTPTFISSEIHGLGVVPVVRFKALDDLDHGDPRGEIEDLTVLQDQIDVTTFGLLVAQHYGAFRQRYIMGWLAENEAEMLKVSMAKVWTFEDPDTKVGDFAETSLDGYIASREATIKHLAAVSQTPAHELVGQLVNLSAEALAAAEASKRRKVTERETMFGESWEQVLELGGQIEGFETDPQAEVRWRDTEARALAATVDALGKMALMLNIPPQELWEKIPGVSQQDVERWKVAASSGDAFKNLTDLLNRQATSAVPATPPVAPPVAAPVV